MLMYLTLAAALIQAIATLAVLAGAIVCYCCEPPVSREEEERALMRSSSWPTAHSSDFTEETKQC
jgi:hypothetical protein